MHEVPLSEMPLRALDVQEALAAQDEESSCPGSSWYFAIGTPGGRTFRLTPSWSKCASPSPSKPQ